MKRRLPLALLTLALAACGQQPGSTETLPPEPVGNYDNVDGSWSKSPVLSAQALTADVNTLYYETALTATNAWGPIEVDRSNGERGIGDGKTLTLNGTRYAKGYGVHAPSELKYSLAGSDNAKCVRFKAQVGVDDEVGSRGSVVFQVWGDGEKLYDSGVMTGASATKNVNVDLRGKKAIRMVVTDAGNGKTADHADWINPTITCLPNITLKAPENTKIYQDTHGTLPITVINNSKQFTGNLTYRLVMKEESNYPTAFTIEGKGTNISGAGIYNRNISVYVPTWAYEEQYQEPGFDSEDLVAYWNGEEVARVPANIVILSQRISISYPEQPYEIHAGETRIVQGIVTITPGGETSGVEINVYSEPTSSRMDDWWEVDGGGTVPKEGGTIPITIKALHAPRPDESLEPDLRLREGQSPFGRTPGKYFSYIKLRYVP
ncbi:NPCBM/NEW2 domain-containing protein [Deinococcus apachensis]|uniref:NPCBM/NEW2 domain-containing protein n=1 Tax=Deinococcus apachensis TaxID=309886 RepID=UPI0009FE1281|nr:NPCBM/NEW2 domain-containing protein [Deinococcus apachensis]